ncbi:hypothetical protein SteCoe_33079 [Stentor coeruleus]|uniref:Cyclic nucleotide-binding domain-containing protein n=1 Tax=Stentor coeruleus TaxID=5963 RepID=A0A1R2AXL4_9CILI|nr:hypothetical protein SteCoe_33079 [Stentor coeruleus]
MFGVFTNKNTFGQEIEAENSGSVISRENASITARRGSFFSRRGSKTQQEIKMQRACSLIDEVIIDEQEPRFRERTEFFQMKFVIFPDDAFKILWDILILCLMLYTLFVVPFRIAFPVTDSKPWLVADLFVDCLFMTDVVVNCLSAYYINDDEIETSNKQILKNYFKTWMIFDISASIPFQLIFDNGNWKSLIRFGRLPRLYRLIKLAKIIRILKAQQGFQKFIDKVGLNFKIPLALKRLLYFLIVFGIICHLITCLWYFASTLQDNQYDNWVNKYGIENYSIFNLYTASLYWTVTTLATVGYGDIVPANSAERGICIIVMLGGVFFYSYTIGTITSLMTDMGKKKAKLAHKLLILQDIDKNYSIGSRLFKEIKSAMEFDQSRFDKEKDEMIASLPKKLALQLNLYMNKKLVEKNKFFKGRQIPFISTVLTCLRPLRVKSKNRLFEKGEFATDMYFVTVGELSLYDTFNASEISFMEVIEGDYFGDVAVILSIPHEYNVKTVKDTQLLVLSRDDLVIKILNIDDNLKKDLNDKAKARQEYLNEKKDKAVSEYIRNKNLVKSVANEKKSDYNGAIYSYQSEQNTRRLKKIRNTLTPKAQTMLEFANVDNEVDILKSNLEFLKTAVSKFQEQIIENKYVRPKEKHKEFTSRLMMPVAKSLQSHIFKKVPPEESIKLQNISNENPFEYVQDQSNNLMNDKELSMKINIENSEGDIVMLKSGNPKNENEKDKSFPVDFILNPGLSPSK